MRIGIRAPYRFTSSAEQMVKRIFGARPEFIFLCRDGGICRLDAFQKRKLACPEKRARRPGASSDPAGIDGKSFTGEPLRLATPHASLKQPQIRSAVMDAFSVPSPLFQC